MQKESALLLSVFLPLAGVFVLPAAGRLRPALRNGLAFLLVVSSFVLSSFMLPDVLSRQAVTVFRNLPLGLNFNLCADGLAVFMAVISSFISAMIILYSFDYIKHYENQQEYYFLVVLFLGAMMGLVFSANLIMLYVFWEITGITIWRLIGFFREKQHVLRADKAFLVTVFGSLVMLLGFIMLFQETG
ncbi:MAG: proton-conducting transporter membrane subunit, partial [Candidatus Omnitrophica bacterium]|nr:proton-conducting transporter membrane subunit [Candidatus Omnitrophota bacterium]